MHELRCRLKTGAHIKRYRVRPKQKVDLEKWNPADTSGFDGKEEDALEVSKKLTKKLEFLQGMLYAEHKRSALIVLQALDTGGKDGTVRKVFEGVNPQSVRVASFKVPTPYEQDRDFLWRVHEQVPGKGEMVIFNRSHYEAVLVERVHKLVPPEVWKERYKDINDFERLLFEGGTIIMKFFLHISKDEQKKRLQDRLKDPTKRWKFSVNDLHERDFWADYVKAYEAALEETSTDHAPWYIIPANNNWFRDLIVSSVIVRTLQRAHMRYPPGPKDLPPGKSLKSIVIK
jgi:PPK2 family polyphosphate:nucleotide phosphotransferase